MHATQHTLPVVIARVLRALSLAGALALGAAACVGSTGGEVFTFDAAAAGPRDAQAGAPLDFVTARGWHVVLTKAVLHVGAVYLDLSEPVSGAQNTSCILPGTYVAQVTSGRDVDLLSPDAQPFPTPGEGTSGTARVGQVWLTGGDVNLVDDSTPILVLEGTADRGSDVRPFTGRITIGANRQARGTTLAGANPICKQRIVSPIPTAVGVSAHGKLVLRVDPRALFVNVDFGALALVGSAYAFTDDSSDPPSLNLYQALHAAGDLYRFEWVDAP